MNSVLSALRLQSALNPDGPPAHAIWILFSIFLVTLGAVFLVVIALALISLLRRHRGINQEPLEQTHQPSAETERALSRAVGVATGATVLILLGLIVISVSAGKSVSDAAVPANPLVIDVTASQWWWNVRYFGDDASRILVTANEIHIPVGRPIVVRGNSLDVIHSFWIPNLQGKRDFIPSRVTTEWFEADAPGKFRGQCAEFCGLQHAHMSLWVVAEPLDKFKAWFDAQLLPAAEPAQPSAEHGRQVFLNSACVLCHSIRGTTAAGQTAPDLTHLASRLTIAAGTLPNNRGNLAGWIADPQSIKPGNHMATLPLASQDLQSLLDYLETLQ